MLIEMLTSALFANKAKWESWRYRPTMWADNGVDAKKIAPAQKTALYALEQLPK